MVRGGQTMTVPNYEVVVGDVMLLDTGDKIIADGYTIEVRGIGGPLAGSRVEKGSGGRQGSKWHLATREHIAPGQLPCSMQCCSSIACPSIACAPTPP